jgi:putative spermidine/putrescine transport system permease protein
MRAKPTVRMRHRTRADRLAQVRSRAFGTSIWAVFVLYSLLPLIATLLFSLSERWVNTVLPESLNLASYAALSREPLFLISLGRSIILAVGALLIVAGLCILLVTWIHIRAPKLAPPAEVISLIPFALPWVVVALALVRFYGEVYPSLLNTPLLLLLAHGAVNMPFMYWALDNNMKAINARRLYEAGATLGARWDQTMRYALLPNLGPGLMTGSMLVFASSFGEYALSRLIVGAGWATLPVWQASLINRDARVTSAVTVVAIAVAIVAALIITIWTARLPGERAAAAAEEGAR